MRFAFSGRGSSAHRLLALSAVLVGCSADPKRSEEEPRVPLPGLSGVHSVLRHGGDVGDYCAARKGGRTAVAEIQSSLLRVRTSDGAALDEASLSPGWDVPAYDGFVGCQMAPTQTGFAVAWLGFDGSSGVRVQRLSDDGAPDGELVIAGPTTRPSAALAAAGDRMYVGRVVDDADGGEVWVDALDGGDVTSERIATCPQPTVPELVASDAAVAVFYVCAGAEQSELFVSVLGEGEPRLLASAPAELGVAAVAAAALDEDSWAVQWAPPGTRANALPPLLEIQRATLDVTSHDHPARGGGLDEEVWFLELVAAGPRLLRQLASCGGADSAEPGCHVELCSLELESSTVRCTTLEQSLPGALLPLDSGATFTFLERGEDAGSDLYSVVLDEGWAITTRPVSAHAPGRFRPLAIDCAGSWCTVLGREGQSLLAGAGVHRYGFWTTEDAWQSAPFQRAIVLEAAGPVVSSAIEPWDWSAGLARFGEAGFEVGSYRADGTLFRRTIEGVYDPTALFLESLEGRYRLFEYDEAGVFVSRTVEASGVGPEVPVGVSTLEVVCGDRGAYTALDPSARSYYRIDAAGISEGAPLPEIRDGSREHVSCLGGSLFGIAFNGSGARVYRGTPRDQAALVFESFDYGNAAADGPLGGGFGAVFGTLADERAVIYLQRAGGFEEPLVAFVLGLEGEPDVYALELPGTGLLDAAAAPRSGEPSALRLVWSELSSRTAHVSSWTLP